MMADTYSKDDMIEDLQEIKQHIAEENLQGAAITILIDDIKEHETMLACVVGRSVCHTLQTCN